MDNTDKTIVYLRIRGASVNEIAEEVGLSYTPTRYRIKRLVAAGEIPSDLPTLKHTKKSWTDQQFIDAVSGSSCYKEALVALGLSSSSSGNRTTIKRHAKRLGLDISHWSSTVNHSGGGHRYTLAEILVEDSDYSTHALHKRLVQEGLKQERCEKCGIIDWLGESVSFELDHINGNPRDHRIENLRMLCPNCHSQTETWRGRNKKVLHLDPKVP